MLSQASMTESGSISDALFNPRPVVKAADSLDEIANTFFKYDCVIVRKLLRPQLVGFFRELCEKQYAEDDARYERNEILNQNWLREYDNGWIWNERFEETTDGVFSIDDIIANRRLHQILDRLMGPSWQERNRSQVRRIHHKGRYENKWGRPTPHHCDAMFSNIDTGYGITVWVPLVPCGQSAPGIEFLLTAPREVLDYYGYDPSNKSPPAGGLPISPHFRHSKFNDKTLINMYNPEKFWSPGFAPGDVAIFSHWTSHKTLIDHDMTNTRISYESYVGVDSFDTLVRPGQQLTLDMFGRKTSS